MDKSKKILFKNATIFDGVDKIDGLSNVLVIGNKISAINYQGELGTDAVEIDCAGKTLMPGLIDGHVHVYFSSYRLADLHEKPITLLAQYARQNLEETLQRGFTTVRDAAGGDNGLAMAIEEGIINGPRFFFSGRSLSQTGGHGDLRIAHHFHTCGCGEESLIAVLVDGEDEVRKAAREELRLGAHQIKIHISGGAVSPTDPLEMAQFNDDEVSVAVEEANRFGRYVMAHCHTDDGARRCVRLGVRSIEHATEIKEDTAKMIADGGVYVVPTLSVVHDLKLRGDDLGFPPAVKSKLDGLYEKMLESIQNCEKHNVKIGFGTDLLDRKSQRSQSNEFLLRSEASGPLAILRSATSVNAEMMKMSGLLGCIKEGAYADLLVVNNNPLDDISVLTKGASEMPVIMKDGKFIRNSL